MLLLDAGIEASACARKSTTSTSTSARDKMRRRADLNGDNLRIYRAACLRISDQWSVLLYYCDVIHYVSRPTWLSYKCLAIFQQFLSSTGDDIYYWVDVHTLGVDTCDCNLTRQGRLQKSTTTTVITVGLRLGLGLGLG